MSAKRKKIVWKSIKVPSEVHKALKTKATDEKQAIHKIITSIILASESKELAEAAKKIPLSAKNIDKALWYCLKLVNGVAMYKQALKISELLEETENDEITKYVQSQREKLIQTITQIEKRLRVNLRDVYEEIKVLEDNITGKDIMRLNDELKKAMIQIINKVVR